ncbi:MAG: winged helix-turn-helix domain-containing protein [Acidobacteriaceae bacterium]|nr:winged helix-turn-helix domain-containing protein [Acidobacteriaceae bacterium]
MEQKESPKPATRESAQNGQSTARGASRAVRKLRFGAFEVDLEEREIRKRGIRVRLQQKPFLVLEMLLERSGTLVTREELEKHLWPDSHVDFDRGLNTAVNALRQALGDSSRECRFIETRSGLGYRFIAPVEVISSSVASPKFFQPDPAIDSEVIRARAAERAERYGANFDAYQDYLKGTYFLSKLTEEDLRKAIAYFESAIASDPNCALAYAGLADTSCQLAMLSVLPAEDARTRAKEFALSALSRDSELAEAHIALARVKMVFDWDWKGAEAECLRALDLEPGHAEGHRCYAGILSALGKAEEALKESRRARVLDPLSLPVSTALAWQLYLARDFEAAVEHCWKVLTLEPRYPAAQYTLGLAYEQLGLYDEAITELRNAIACAGDCAAATAAVARVYATAGMQAEAMRTLRELDELSTRRYVSCYWQSIVRAALGEQQSALDGLEKACERRDAPLCWLKVDPRWDSLRSESRFLAVLRKLSFETQSHAAPLAATAMT